MKFKPRNILSTFVFSYIFYMLFILYPIVTDEGFRLVTHKVRTITTFAMSGSLACFVFGIMAMVAYICNIFIYGTLRMAKSNVLRAILIAVYVALDVALFFGLKTIIATGAVWPMLRFMVHLLLFFHVVFFVKWAVVAYCRNQKVPETSVYYKN